MVYALNFDEQSEKLVKPTLEKREKYLLSVLHERSRLRAGPLAPSACESLQLSERDSACTTGRP
jgi:hypothetical protein